MAPSRDIIIVVGPPRSGKTTAAGLLEADGYKRISASGVIGRLERHLPPLSNRIDLIKRGERMLAEQGPIWFGEKLLEEAAPFDKIVFDGIRPLATIKHIIRHEPGTRVVFIKANEHNRRRRHALTGDANLIPYDDIANAAVEKTSKGVDALAIFVDNNGDEVEFYRNLRNALHF